MAKKEYVSGPEAAAMVGISSSRMRALCRQGRVPGARLIGGAWIVPERFKITPADPRRRRPGKISA